MGVVLQEADECRLWAESVYGQQLAANRAAVSEAVERLQANAELLAGLLPPQPAQPETSTGPAAVGAAAAAAAAATAARGALQQAEQLVSQSMTHMAVAIYAHGSDIARLGACLCVQGGRGDGRHAASLGNLCSIVYLCIYLDQL